MKNKKDCKYVWLAEYRAKFSPNNLEAKTFQQQVIMFALMAQVELKKRSPVRLFSLVLGVPTNYVWNNAKIYWKGLVERWKGLEIDDGFELAKFALLGSFRRILGRHLTIYETTLNSIGRL